MTSKSNKSWKDHLLSSGLPLEYSVSRIFRELGAWQPREFRYERKDSDEKLRTFSVDVHASRIDTKRNVWLETLVECKYRHDGTRWVFTAQEYDSLFGPDFDDVFVALDQCCEERQFNRAFMSEFRSRYPLCEKGIEVLTGDANPKSIEQAVQQLRHAVIAKSIDAIVHQAECLLGKPTPLFVMVPIIVTTAELWRLNSDISVEAVRAAQEIREVAQPCDLVVLAQKPDNMDRKHAHERFQDSLHYTQKEKAEKILRSASKIGANELIERICSRFPSLFVIIRYDRFKTAITNLHDFFDREEIVSARVTG